MEIWKCKCSICDCRWAYDITVEEDIVRATCAPCGHQGLFEVNRGENNK